MNPRRSSPKRPSRASTWTEVKAAAADYFASPSFAWSVLALDFWLGDLFFKTWENAIK